MKKRYLILFVFAGCIHRALAQDPQLPSANLGLTNLQAGRSKEPGLYYTQYMQVYNARDTKDGAGDMSAQSRDISSLLSLQQLIWVTRLHILGGNFGVNVLMPLTITADKSGRQTVNSNAIGDILAGPFIEWQHRTGAGQSLYYRLGINFFAPTGAYSPRYDINPGSNRYRYFPHLEVTYVPLNWLAFSIKDNFYLYFREHGSPERSGTTNDINYAVELKLTPKITLEAAGYYLKQLAGDSYNGDRSYYLDHYGIRNTKEQLFGIGPGIGYMTDAGLSMELKAIWESLARNRSEGFRGTLVISFPL